MDFKTGRHKEVPGRGCVILFLFLSFEIKATFIDIFQMLYTTIFDWARKAHSNVARFCMSNTKKRSFILLKRTKLFHKDHIFFQCEKKKHERVHILNKTIFVRSSGVRNNKEFIHFNNACGRIMNFFVLYATFVVIRFSIINLQWSDYNLYRLVVTKDICIRY